MSKSKKSPAAQPWSVRISYPYLGYLLLLLAFVSLGLFVAALAHGSGLALDAGTALAVLLVGSATCFWKGSRAPAPDRREQHERYREMYRGEAVVAPASVALRSRRAASSAPATIAPERLSA
jgi:putative intracellular protease/amidase